MVLVRKFNFSTTKPWKFGIQLKDIQNQNFLGDLRMNASGPSAQIMSGQIMSDKVVSKMQYLTYLATIFNDRPINTNDFHLYRIDNGN